MVRIRIAKRRVEAYLMRYIIFYLLKKSNSFLEFFSFYFYITILMLYCQTNIDKMHKLLYIKNKKEATTTTIIHISNYVTLPTLSAVLMSVSVITLLRLILFLFAPNRQTCRQLARLNHCRN